MYFGMVGKVLTNGRYVSKLKLLSKQCTSNGQGDGFRHKRTLDRHTHRQGKKIPICHKSQNIERDLDFVKINILSKFEEDWVNKAPPTQDSVTCFFYPNVTQY